MNTDEYIYLAVSLAVLGLGLYAIYWVCSRIYWKIKWGSLDPIFREKD